MPDPKTPALRAPAQVIEPDKLKAAAARAQEERERIHAAGKHEGLRVAERYRTFGLVAMGAVGGFVLGAWLTVSAYERGVFTAGAVADRVLQRTVNANEPFSALSAIPADQGEGETQGCAPGQRMQGGRRCPPEPPSVAPQRRR